MIPRLKLATCILTVLLPLFFTTICSAQKYDYVDINNPFLRKIPVAVPYFKRISGAGDEVRLSKDAAQLLSDSLAFTGYFKTVDRGAYLIDPDKPNIVSPHINFKNWTGIGAELLITGGVLVENGISKMEFRLYDPFKGRLMIGKRYTGGVEDYRRMVHRFCSEVMHLLTGSRGIFGSKIAFISANNGNKEIYTCDFDGTNIQQLTRQKSINLSPAWSSDGQWIAYTSYANGKPDLFIKHVSEKRGAVVNKKGTSISPDWIPGRFELAASLSYQGDPEIYLLTGQGKVIKKLTNSRGIDVSPSFSPDGRKMAFVSKRAGSPQIYIQDLASGKAERLTFEGRNNTQPTWSPKGDKIAYCGMKKGQNNIHVIGLNGKGLAQLTYNSGDNEAPSWSPDGSLIVFNSTREGTSRIYLMTAFGTDQRRLLTLPGKQSEPTWSLNIDDGQ
jgi:TolB protein